MAVTGREADVVIFGDITSWPWEESDVSSYNLRQEIAGLDVDTIHVHINSYGGECAEGLAITNALLQHPAKVITYVDGFACSAASIILMAGERRVAAKCSNVLVHPASSGMWGNASDLRREADNLDAITQQSVNAYLSRISKSREELLALMEEERFLTPEEALEWGFVTEVQDLFGSDQPTQSVRELVHTQLHQPHQPSHSPRQALDETKVLSALREAFHI
jgi:ATP-dependent protease ClpP protease subunit